MDNIVRRLAQKGVSARERNVQASQKCTFLLLAGAKAPDPDAACGRKAFPESESNATNRRESTFVGFRKTAPTENERDNAKQNRLKCVRDSSCQKNMSLCFAAGSPVCVVLSGVVPPSVPEAKGHNRPKADFFRQIFKKDLQFLP